MPQNPPPQVPVVTFPDPAIDHRLLADEWNTELAGYQPLEPGARHPNAREYPGYYLVRQQPSRAEKWVTRVWVNDPAAQNTYNAEVSYQGDDPSYPTFTRRYKVKRVGYLQSGAATPLSSLTAVVGARVTAAGAGYTSEPDVTPSGGWDGGATFRALIFQGAVVWVVVKNEGTGYTSAPTLVFSGGGGSGAAATAYIQPPSARLVREETNRLVEGPEDSLFIGVTRVWMTLPGPWVVTRTKLPGGEYLEEKKRLVAAGTDPAGGGNLVLDTVHGQSTTLAEETVRAYVDVDGNPQSAPIHIHAQYVDELSIFRYTFRQMVQAPGTLKQFDTTDSGVVNLGSKVDAITVGNHGAGYTFIPAVEIQPSMGTGATAHARLKLNGTQTVAAAGTGYAINDVLTLDSGTFVTAGTVTVSAVGLDSIVLVAPGSGVSIGQIITLTGGIFSTAAQVTVVTGQIASIGASAPGSGYHTGETIALAGGTAALAGEVSVATVQLVTLQRNAIGSGYANGDIVTLGGGTASVRAAVYVDRLALASVAVNAPGINYDVGQTITLAGGSVLTPGQVTVNHVQLVSTFPNPSDPGTGYLPGDTVTLAGGTFSTAAVVTVDYVLCRSLALNAAGSGYAEGDLVTLAGGTFLSPLVIQVLTVGGGGAIATFANVQAGAYSVTASSFTQGSTTGSGTGATFNMPVWGAVKVHVTTAGDYTVTTPTFTQASTSGTGAGIALALARFGVKTVTVSAPGEYNGTPPSTAFTQGSSSGAGTGATFNTPSWGVATFLLVTAGQYSVEASSFTQFSTTGSGSGATFNTPVWGVRSVTVTVPGEYSFAGTAFSQASTSGTGTGVVFSSPTLGVKSFAVSRAGSYTPTLPSSFSSSFGATFNTPAWGAGAVTLTTSGAGYTNFAMHLASAGLVQRGAGYAVGDTVELMPGNVMIRVTAIRGAGAFGPINTFVITNGGSISADSIDRDQVFTQLGTAGSGAGVVLRPTAYRALLAASGGSGTGAACQALFAVDDIGIDEAGNQYHGAPTVRIEAPLGGGTTATATATVQVFGTGGLLTQTIYLEDQWVEPIPDTDRVWLNWVMVPIPPKRVETITHPFTKPGLLVIPAAPALLHDPPWFGIDFYSQAPQSGEWKATATREYRLGPFLETDLPPTYRIITPGANSRIFPCGNRMRHDAWEYYTYSGSKIIYGEKVEASAEVGYDLTAGYTVLVEHKRVPGTANIWERTIVQIAS